MPSPRTGGVPQPLRPAEQALVLLLPAVLGCAALGVLVYDHFDPLSGPLVAAAAATLLAVIALLAISARKLVRMREEHLLFRERANAAQRLQAVGELASGVAHDFNNLLAALTNYGHVITESLPPGDRLREDAAEIVRICSTAAELSHRLLLVSHRDPPEPGLVGLHEALHTRQKMLRSAAGEHVRVRVFTDPGLPAVRVSPGELDQILLNLVINARDAMPAGGDVSILAEQAGDSVTVTVRDNGEGMAEGVAERAFEPFFSGGSDRCGTGLGLPTVKTIVEKAGGSVWLRSRPGLGTSVMMSLPALTWLRTPVALEETPTGRGERILVAEHDPTVRRSRSILLRANGYRVLEAAESDEALLLAAEHEIHLLLTEVAMPTRPGYEIAARLRVRKPDLPVVFTSSYPPEVLCERALDWADATVLTKPVGTHQLLMEVRAALDAGVRA